jgi:TonB family protein
MLVEQVSDPRVVQRWTDALASPQPEIRAAAARGILVTGARPLVPALRKALQVEEDRGAGRELAAAVILVGAPDDVRAALAASDRLQHNGWAGLWLSRRRGSQFATEAADFWMADLQARRRPPAPSSARLPLQTLRDLPVGLVGDALRTFGCRPSEPAMIFGANVGYRADGRPARVTLLGDFEKPTPCSRAARVLLMNTIAPEDAIPGRIETILLPLDSSHLGCTPAATETKAPAAVDSDGGGAPPKHIGGQIKEPRKLRNLRPIYPKKAKDAGIQGVVLLEATITPSGCVSVIEGLSSPELSLSVEAVRAVAGWTYTPTLLEGVAVPVIMTVTVNFRLN